MSLSLNLPHSQADSEETSTETFAIKNANARKNWELIKQVPVKAEIGPDRVRSIFNNISDAKVKDFLLKQLALKNGQTVSAKSIYVHALFGNLKLQESTMMKTRKPVVTIMGHVDHGKTTILDFYRSSDVAAHEVGGITQKIGGFVLNTPHGEISFIDTPGHEVFETMRRIGARAADIIVLTVAANDGIKKQTEEVLALAQELRIPLIIAINKIDSRDANIERVEQQLLDAGVEIEPAGGDVPVLHISALKGRNMDLLAELICEFGKELNLQCDVNPAAQPECLVIESKAFLQGAQRKATVIVKNGVLKPGQLLTVRKTFFKVNQIHNHKGESLPSASMCDIVEVSGMTELPFSGSSLIGLPNQQDAKQWQLLWKLFEQSKRSEEPQHDQFKLKVSRREKRATKANSNFFGDKMGAHQEVLTEELKSATDTERIAKIKGYLKDIQNTLFNFTTANFHNPIVIKTSDQGTLDTIKNYLEKLNNQNITVLRLECGDVNEQDIVMCKEVGATLYTFDIPDTSEAIDRVRESKIPYKPHFLIHRLFEDISKIGTLEAPQTSSSIGLSRFTGRATIAKIMTVSLRKKEVKVLGVKVTEGTLKFDGKFKIIREGRVVTDGLQPNSMRQFKEDVTELAEAQEGGITFAKMDMFREGDTLECFS